MYCKLITLFIFISQSSPCVHSADSDYCADWVNYCKAAQTSSDNHFHCYIDHDDLSESVILLYETNHSTTWDKARASCATKFNGNSMADLVELGGSKKSFVIDMLNNIRAPTDTEIATSGVCCMRKVNPLTTNVECEWLPSRGPMDDIIQNIEDNRCAVYTVNYADKKLTKSSPMYQTSQIHNVMCGFNVPNAGCRIPPDMIPTKPPITASTTTTPTASSSSAQHTDHPTTEDPDIGDLRQVVMDGINISTTLANELCPALIECRALQKQCFEQWMIIDNQTIGAAKATTAQELEDINKILNDVEGKLSAIKVVHRMCVEAQRSLDRADKLATTTCPLLIHYPALQKDCFGLWIRVDNDYTSLRETDALNGFDVIFNDSMTIEEALKKIRKDAKLDQLDLGLTKRGSRVQILH